MWYLISTKMMFIIFFRWLFGGLFLVSFGFCIGFMYGFYVDVKAMVDNQTLGENMIFALFFGISLMFFLILWIVFWRMGKQVEVKKKKGEAENLIE